MPDAILVPNYYPAGKVDMDRLRALNKEFGEPLKAKRGVVQVRHVHLGGLVVDLLTALPDAPAYFFPKGHPQEGLDRYEWEDRGDGVRHGTLVEDVLEAENLKAAEAEGKKVNEEKYRQFLQSPQGGLWAAAIPEKDDPSKVEQTPKAIATEHPHAE